MVEKPEAKIHLIYYHFDWKAVGVHAGMLASVDFLTPWKKVETFVCGMNPQPV